MTNPPPDERNKETFEIAFAGYKAFLSGYVRANFSSADADEVVQEALVKLWLSWAKFDGEDARPWLRTVARNLVVDGWRERAKVAYRLGEVDPAVLISALGRPEHAYRTTEMLQACQRLSRNHQIVFVSRVCGLTVDEIATVNRFTKGTVSSYFSRALRQLRKMLDDGGRESTSAADRARQAHDLDASDEQVSRPVQNSGDV